MIQVLDVVQEILKQLLVMLPLLSALTAFLYWRLQKRVETEIAHQLERTKHELQLELQKKSIVFQHQKDSFHRVIIGLNEALESIEQNSDDGEWNPIRESHHEKLRKVISAESLFSDDAADHALYLFRIVMYHAVVDEPQGQYPDTEEVLHAYKWLKFISIRLVEHYRERMGMLQSIGNPLVDVELLGACRLLTTWNFPQFDFPTTTVLKCTPSQSPEETCDIAKLHLDLLGSELHRLRNAMMSKKDRAAFYYEYIVRIDRYLKQVALLSNTLSAPARTLSTSA